MVGDEAPHVEVLGVKVHALTAEALLEAIAVMAAAGDHAIVAHANVHALNLGCQQPWFRHFLNQARIVFCDGAGVMLGAWLLGRRLPERITYADWAWQLAEFAAARGLAVYLLGARPGVAERAAGRLRDRFPALVVAGTHSGFFDKNPSSAENKAVVQSINAAQPNILVIAFGMPLQEAWLRDNWDSIQANVALTAGAALDYVAGDLARGPRWMTGHGLEWLARLIIEPRRLWRRYLAGNPLFLWRVILQRFGWLKLRETTATARC